MNSIVSAASGRIVSSSTTSARGSSRGGGSAPGSAGRPAGASPKAITLRPWAVCSESARSSSGGSVIAPAPISTSGAPITKLRPRPSPFSVRPLHFHFELNGTSSEIVAGSAGNASAIVSRVRLRSPADAANRPSTPSASSREPGAGTTAISRRVPSVSVPVLSTQIVSTAASASVAAICCTSARWRARRTAATASVTLMSSTRPSGMSVIRPAVAVWAASVKLTLRRLSAASRITASGIMTSVVARRIWFTSCCNGEGGWRKVFASPASFAA